MLSHAIVVFDIQKRTGPLNDTNSCMPESEKAAVTKNGAGTMKIRTDLMMCLSLHETFRAHDAFPGESQISRGVNDIVVREPLDNSPDIRADKRDFTSKRAGAELALLPKASFHRT
jgi:hypothetical protein